MLREEMQSDLRQLIGMTNPDGEQPFDLLLARTRLTNMLRSEYWPTHVQQELEAIDRAFDRYTERQARADVRGATQPLGGEFEAIVARIRALERFLTQPQGWPLP